MDELSTATAMRRWRAKAQTPVALVPTMGAVHAGHLALVADAQRRCASVVVSIFVNPLQFAPTDDLDRYPRDLDGDLAVLRAAGVDAVFVPSAATFVPADLATTVSVAAVTDRFEGASRPGHFDGVATIVTKLLSVTRPAVAVFGQKDYQQLLVVRRLAADLDLDVEIVGVEIVRDADGLALSSRNRYLSAIERGRALTLSTALRTTADLWTGDAEVVRSALRSLLADADIDVEYADVVDAATLAPLTGMGHRSARAIVAARVGGTRLIDNWPLTR